MDRSWVRSITNTCGEPEREAKSRKHNVIEAFAVMTFVLTILWLFAYPFGVLLKIEAVNTISHVLLFLGAAYLLVVSPLLHKDTLYSWGLGDPVKLLKTLIFGRGIRRVMLGAVLLALIVMLTAEFYIHWIKAARFLFSIETEKAARIQESFAGKLFILHIGALMAAFFATCVIRYDNFFSAFFTALKIIAVLGPMLYLTALGVVGVKAFADFQPSKFALDVFGYVFWGVMQQLLFSSYFGTRIRKGFGPAGDPARINKRRFWVAVLNGSFFALIHINSWYLMGLTWLLGAVLSYVFMRDKNRNLVALGFVHGFLGSSTGWLLSSNNAHIVDMSVGPWHMHGFDLPTMIFVVPLIGSYVAFMIYAYLHWRED